MMTQCLILILAISYAVISNGIEQAKYSSTVSSVSEHVADGMALFTSKLGKIFADEFKEENSLFSPVNLLNALALLHLGSNGQTRDELADVLGFPKDEKGASAAQESFAASLKQLRSSNVTKVELAAALFVQRGISLNESYVQEALSKYDSEVRNVNFQSPMSTVNVNNWIAKKTHDRIPRLFSGPMPASKLLIVTALYFSGNWTNQFKKSKTIIGQFTTSSRTSDVHMMLDTQSVPYYESPSSEFRAIGLLYEHNDYAMYIILPNELQSLSNIIQSLQPQQLHEIVETSVKNSTLVEYKIPRTKYMLNQVMNNDLTEIGLKKLFSSADLGRIYSGDDGDPILNIQHVAEIEIDEAGTVGSAITTIPFRMARPELSIYAKTTFYVDRPFAFYIYYYPTKSIIFYGQVYKPVP